MVVEYGVLLNGWNGYDAGVSCDEVSSDTWSLFLEYGVLLNGWNGYDAGVSCDF
jgi:hypothetical protein